jgi:ligand-binding SRPBCC domain-containing protein
VCIISEIMFMVELSAWCRCYKFFNTKGGVVLIDYVTYLVTGGEVVTCRNT